MKFGHRLTAIPTLASLALAGALLVPTLATADPLGIVAEGREVVSVTPIEGAPTAEELSASRADDTGGRSMVVRDDGTILVLEDRDFTSADSTRNLPGDAVALAERPSAFDLRDASFNGAAGSFVTPVKSQNPFGACWAFGIIAASESSVLSETGTPVTDPATAPDYSEKQLTWFTFAPWADAPDGQGSEGFYTAVDPSSDTSAPYDLGGTADYATTLFAMGVGPALESRDASLVYHNAAGEYADYGDGYDEPVATGDWSVPESQRFASDLELEETFLLPSPASYEAVEGSGYQRYVFNPAGVDAIKDQLLAGRGVAIGFCADASMPDFPDEYRYIDLDTYAHYTYESPYEGAEGGEPNHMVCIVGYDDAYSRENFLEGHEPPADGAFLVKNSWGAEDASYGNRSDWGVDGSGYFYLSYYDKSLATAQAFDFVTPADGELAAGTGGDATVHHYDYLPGSPMPDTYDTVTSMANIFEVDEPSVLRSVSTRTNGYDARVRLDVYRLRAGADDPTDGTLVWSHDGSYRLGGYHRVALDEPIVAKVGERFGVVATTTLPDGSYELMSNAFGSKLWSAIQIADPENRAWGETRVNPGESFFGAASSRVEFSDGSYAWGGYDWIDLADDIVEGRAGAERVLDEAGIDGLLAERDRAQAAYAALSPDDPGSDEAWMTLQLAQMELSQAVDAVWYDAFYALYAMDNYSLSLTTEPIDPDDPPVAATVEMLRLYDPGTGEHLYTADPNERDALVASGWSDKGVGWTAPAHSNTPVYRLFNPETGEHLYTADGNERNVLAGRGWNDEGVAFYSDNAHTVAVHRLYDPDGADIAAHHYATDAHERDQLVRDGWRNEGISWYGL